MTATRSDWSEEAKGLLKAEMKRRGLTYAGLVEALAYVGLNETEANLRNKVSRGNFSAAFLLQALNAIGCTVIYLGEPTERRPRISPATRANFLASKRRLEDGTTDE